MDGVCFLVIEMGMIDFGGVEQEQGGGKRIVWIGETQRMKRTFRFQWYLLLGGEEGKGSGVRCDLVDSTPRDVVLVT